MAIGSGSEGAQTTLQEEYKPDVSLKEAEVLALSTLKQVMEEKVGLGPHTPRRPLATAENSCERIILQACAFSPL